MFDHSCQASLNRLEIPPTHRHMADQHAWAGGSMHARSHQAGDMCVWCTPGFSSNPGVSAAGQKP